jgi:hypothetical protein
MSELFDNRGMSARVGYCSDAIVLLVANDTHSPADSMPDFESLIVTEHIHGR